MNHKVLKMAYKAIVREINLNQESFVDESEVDPNNNF